jgi:hypothetical protein
MRHLWRLAQMVRDWRQVPNTLAQWDNSMGSAATAWETCLLYGNSRSNLPSSE